MLLLNTYHLKLVGLQTNQSKVKVVRVSIPKFFLKSIHKFSRIGCKVEGKQTKINNIILQKKRRRKNPLDILQIILRQLHSVLETFAGSPDKKSGQAVQPRLHYFVSSAKASGVRLSDATKA
jgi:hypothetical protein